MFFIKKKHHIPYLAPLDLAIDPPCSSSRPILHRTLSRWMGAPATRGVYCGLWDLHLAMKVKTSWSISRKWSTPSEKSVIVCVC